MKMEAQPVAIASNSGAHIRSRITVVCAECKRLKLKCDRRTPCSSCIKRDTVPRCLYSAAAAEKIDIQSLHNRVLTLESQLSQLASQSFSSPSGSGNNPRSFLNDRNIVAAGASGSSIIISLDDIAGIWLDALDLSAGDEQIVLTPQQPSLPAGAPSALVFTDLDFNKFRIPPTFGDPVGGLGVTPALIHLLPQSTAVRDELLQQLETVLELHPCVNFPHFKGRILELYKYASVAGVGKYTGVGGMVAKSAVSRARSASTSLPVIDPSDADTGRPSTSASAGASLPRPSLSFFSAAAAAFALAARILGSAAPVSAAGSAPPNGNGGGNGGNGTQSGRAGTAGTGPGQDSHHPPPPSLSTSGLANGASTVNGLNITNATGPMPSPPVNSPRGPRKSPSVPSPPGVPPTSGSGRPTTAHSYSNPSPPNQPASSHPNNSPVPVSPSQHAHIHAHAPLLALPPPSSLFTLSVHSLTMHELSGSYDLDYLVALLLQVLFLLYDNGGLRNPSVPQILFPMVGKMVNVARMMGLWVDPSEVGSPSSVGQGSRYGLFETEMRRRIWWDVYFYDLFVSDAMGQSPLIQDDVATCNLPTDVNEELFSPSSTSFPHPTENGKSFTYFPLKCRLAQLVKGMKKRTFRDPFRAGGCGSALALDPTSGGELSIDAAIAFESEVAAWIAEIPPKYRLNMLEEDVHALIQNGNPVLIAQQCEIMTVTARLVIKIFVPFLRRASKSSSSGGGGGGGDGGGFGQMGFGFGSGSGFGFGFGNAVPASSRTPHHAIHACVNAAHTIIHASKVAHALFKYRSSSVSSSTHSHATSIRAESLFYSFGRQIFDAAVISAHSVITSPQSLFAKVAMEDLKVALEIMRDPVCAMSGGGSGGGSTFRSGLEGAPGEALKIIEILQSKAEAARSGSGAPVLGVKRKHSEVEGSLRSGFQLPYVGGGVYTSFSSGGGGGGDMMSDNRTVMSAGSDSGAGRTKFERRENHIGRDRSHKNNYPAIGVRVRTDSSKSTDSGKGLGLNGEVGKGKGKAVVTGQLTNGLPPATMHRNGVAGPSGSNDAATFSPPPPPPPVSAASVTIASQQQQLQSPSDYQQMVSPVGYGQEPDESMMQYNSQPTSDYPQNPPPSSHGMYDYGTPNPVTVPGSGPGPSPTGPFYPPPNYANPGPVYSHSQQPPTLSSHGHGHPHNSMNMPPPMLALAHPMTDSHSHASMDSSPSMGGGTPRDNRFQQQQQQQQQADNINHSHPRAEESMPAPMQYDVGHGQVQAQAQPQAPPGWMDPGSRFPPPPPPVTVGNPSWNNNYGFWKGGPG